MLTAYQIDELRGKTEQLLDPIIDFLIEDIARRIAEAGQLTSTASYQIWRAQNLGISQRQIKKELRKRLKVSHRELRRLLTQAAETGYNFDINRFPQVQAVSFNDNFSLQQILNAAVQLAQDDLTNMVQTIGFVGPDGGIRELTQAYQHACDFAFQKVFTGAQDYNSAIRDATRNLAQKGIRFIDYESGVHTSLEAAARRNIMGGLGLMQEQISQQNHDDLGCDGWEISAHFGSAPDHEPYQGKQYSDAEYIRLNNSLVRRIGTLNCGHSAMPIILGVNEPQYTTKELEQMRQENEEGVTYEGKHYTVYEATQRQRKLERSIRNQKRKILIDEATGDSEKLQWDQIRLVRYREEYSRFSKAAELPMQHERAELAGFNWKKGKAASKTQQVLQNVERMAQPNNRDNDWSKTISRVVSKIEKSELMAYAAERGIKIPGLKNFDGDPNLLRAEIDALASISEEFPVGKRLTLSISHSLPDEEFASTTGEHITINAKALRDRTITEQNLSNGSMFASSKLEDIIKHEYGHVISSNKGNKGIEITRKVVYNIFGENKSLDELLAYLHTNVSPYSTAFRISGPKPNLFDSKKYKEIIPEVLVKNENTPDEFTEEFIRILKELL